MPQTYQRCLLLAGMTVACAGHDHTFNKVVAPNPPESIPSSLRVDLAIQENDWGAKVTRCQMQVAFEPLPEYVDPEDAADDSPEPPEETEPAPQVLLPVAPGDCAFSEMAPPEPGSDGSLDADNWQLSGNIIGPTYVEMWRDSDTWTLDAVDTDHGGLRYEWSECDRDAYPFSSTLTMDVPASDDPDGVYPFTMDDLVPVGPRVLLDIPPRVDSGQPIIDIGQPLDIEWHTDGALPELNGDRLMPDTLVKLQTQDHEREEGVRWLVCWPEDDGWIQLSAETLAPLFADRTDPERYTTNLDIHMELLMEDRPTPWGEALTVRTNVSTGAGLRAIDPGESAAPPDE